jgi:hypothetical protein
MFTGVPKGFRTPVAAVKGKIPGLSRSAAIPGNPVKISLPCILAYHRSLKSTPIFIPILYRFYTATRRPTMNQTLKIDTREARSKLSIPADRRPYWRQLTPGVFIGYRKNATGGV